MHPIVKFVYWHNKSNFIGCSDIFALDICYFIWQKWFPHSMYIHSCLKAIDNYCDFFINLIVKHYEEENMNEWKFSNHELLPEASELLYSWYIMVGRWLLSLEISIRPVVSESQSTHLNSKCFPVWDTRQHLMSVFTYRQGLWIEHMFKRTPYYNIYRFTAHLYYRATDVVTW